MTLTPYHTKHFADELVRRCPSDSVERLAGTLVDAQVDLNPHQIETALFAFRSPFSKGAILADEVGLGRTIEAGEGLEEDVARCLLSLPAREVDELAEGRDNMRAAELPGRRKETIRQTISQRKARFFEPEAEKLDGWADELKVGLEREIKEIDRQIKEARHSATAALTHEQKLAGQKQIKNLERQRVTEKVLFVVRWRLV